MGLDLEALKKKYDPEHGWASARDEECREVLALIEELAEARLRLKPYEDARLLSESEVVARLKADLVHAHKVHAAEIRECQRIIANARASALEEAAGVLLRYGYAPGCLEIRDIRALAQTSPSGRYVESVVLHSILGHIEASMQHTHGVDCRGFDDGDDLNSDGDCGCGLVSASKARAALAALEGAKP